MLISYTTFFFSATPGTVKVMLITSLQLLRIICHQSVTCNAIKVLRVIGLSPCQPDHAFESSSTTIKIITTQVVWLSTLLRKVPDPVTMELHNHFDYELENQLLTLMSLVSGLFLMISTKEVKKSVRSICLGATHNVSISAPVNTNYIQ